MTATATATCPNCGHSYAYAASELADRLVAAYGVRALCEACSRPENEDDGFSGYWSRTIGAYNVAVPARVSAPLRPALSWRPTGAECCGIGITGEPGAGKSMALALAVKNLRRSFRWISGTKARDIATDAASGEGGDKEAARRILFQLGEIPVLIIDDIDKAKFTDAWAAKLFELLESRNRRSMVTLWTANNNPEQLAQKISAGCGDRHTGRAIERRLCQFSLVLTL